MAAGRWAAGLPAVPRRGDKGFMSSCRVLLLQRQAASRKHNAPVLY